MSGQVKSAGELLQRVKETQAAFWQALSDLEDVSGLELSANWDYSDATLEYLREMQ